MKAPEIKVQPFWYQRADVSQPMSEGRRQAIEVLQAQLVFIVSCDPDATADRVYCPVGDTDNIVINPLLVQQYGLVDLFTAAGFMERPIPPPLEVDQDFREKLRRGEAFTPNKSMV